MAMSTSNNSTPHLNGENSSIRTVGPHVSSIDHVLIVGAGLCGLATAIGLSKAGIRTTLLERSSELREVRDLSFHIATQMC